MNRTLVWAVSAAFLAGLAIPALAAGKIFYGSRAGMTVTVVSMSGLDTANAVIKTKHTREDAISFCREYLQKVTKECIDRELGTRLNDEIRGNCETGVFKDFSGNGWRFAGKVRKPDMAKYRLIDLRTGQDADGSGASGYGTAMGIYKALCPRTAPADADG